MRTYDLWEINAELNEAQNKLDKACFAQDAAYVNNKDLAKRTVSNNILKDRTYATALIPETDGQQKRLAIIM